MTTNFIGMGKSNLQASIMQYNIILIKAVGALLLKAQFCKHHYLLDPSNPIWKQECEETLQAAQELNNSLPTNLRMPMFDSFVTLAISVVWPEEKD